MVLVIYLFQKFSICIYLNEIMQNKQNNSLLAKLSFCILREMQVYLIYHLCNFMVICSHRYLSNMN